MDEEPRFLSLAPSKTEIMALPNKLIQAIILMRVGEIETKPRRSILC